MAAIWAAALCQPQMVCLVGRPAQYAHSSNWALMRMPCLKLTIVGGCCIDQQAATSIYHPPPTANNFTTTNSVEQRVTKGIIVLFFLFFGAASLLFSCGGGGGDIIQSASSRINLLPTLSVPDSVGFHLSNMQILIIGSGNGFYQAFQFDARAAR